MIQEIDQYLQMTNPDFNTGFGLFCKYSRQESLMSYIGRTGNREILIYELRKLSQFPPKNENPNEAVHYSRYNRQPTSANQAPAPAAPVLVEEVRFKTFDERKTRRADLSLEMQKIYDDTISEYPVRRGYHEKMKFAITDKDRAEYRAKILESEERIKAGWAKIDTWLANPENKAKPFSDSIAKAYIYKALKAKKITPTLQTGVQARVKALEEHGLAITADLKKELKAKGLLG